MTSPEYSPSQQGYGDLRRSVPELRAGRQAVGTDNERWPPRPESVQRVRGRSSCGSGVHRQGQGALQARASHQGAQLLRSRPRRLVAAPVAARVGDRHHRGRLLEHRGQPACHTRQDRSARWRQATGVAAALPRQRAACVVGAARADAATGRCAPRTRVSAILPSGRTHLGSTENSSSSPIAVTSVVYSWAALLPIGSVNS